jgi:hypothetical protein
MILLLNPTAHHLPCAVVEMWQTNSQLPDANRRATGI